MTITEATIKKVLYFPEQLPDSAVPDIAASSEASPAMLDLRQFPPLLVRLSKVAVDRDDEVEMRFKVDNTILNSLAGSMFDGLANNFSLLAKSRLYYNLYNSGAAEKTDYKTFYSLWVIKPTVAHKLRWGIPLTAEEQKLNRDLGISDTVEKGLLPLPLSAFQLDVPTAGVHVETLHPLPNQFLLLTKLSAACEDGSHAAGDNIRIVIDRDYVSDYIDFPIWALGTTHGVALEKEISCFIPALKELRIRLTAGTARDDVDIRFTVQKVALTNIFRARWGLATREELPGDVYDKVMAGVL
ncbi:hypothetical protein ES703_113659 [subsurface metagenome]